MIDLVEQNLDAIRALCRRYRVARLALFGSAATDAYRDASSDLDFLVAFADPALGSYADRYLAFAEALEMLFGRPVDLVTERSVRNPYFRRELEATRQVIYDERDEETAA
jgi:predicted nucleotidyltransferase